MSGKDQQITVSVRAPRALEPKEFTWDKNTKVGDGAKQAAEAFGYSSGTPTFQKGEDILDRNKPLVAEKVHDGDVLDLVDAGGGVCRALQ
jgi:hypothetical protein